MTTSIETKGSGFIDKPYIRARRSASGLRLDGVANCSLGRKIESSTPGKEEGIFAEWTWDGVRLVVRNDHYGFFPLFYVHDADSVCISTSLVKLLELGAPTKLNAAGLAVFLRLGWFIRDDTPFEAIHAFPPGATLEWRDGICRITSPGPLIAKLQHISYDEAIDRYVALFKAAIHRFAPPSDKFAVPLSGGRDSRHILLELNEAGYRPDACVTQRSLPASTDKTDENVAIAKQICRALDIRHVIVEQSPSKLSAELRKNILTEFCALEHAWILPATDHVTACWDYSYGGIGGDVLSAGLFLTAKRIALFDSGYFEALANEIMEGDDGYLPHLLSAREYKQFSRDLAIQSLVSELSRHADAPNPVGSFYFYNRTRRTIALCAFKMFGRKAVILMPYLDHELYGFLTSLPASFFLDHQFHTQAILRAYPRYAHIPFENKRQPLILDIKYFHRFAVDITKYLLREPGGPLLHRSGLALPIFHCLIDRNYASQILGFGSLALYLQQLGKF